MRTTAAVAILGGTGDLGGGLARFLLRQGVAVIIGSRDAERARHAAAELKVHFKNVDVRGESLVDAAAAAGIVAITVPYSAHQATLAVVRDVVQGKLVFDTTVPLRPPKVLRVQLPAAGCAALEAQQILGDGVRVVAGLHNIAAAHLTAGTAPDCDVLVTGDKEADRQVIIDLLQAGGLRAWHAGPLANSAASEALTSILIGINKRYGIHGAGIRITGEPRAA
ncbi:MAG TPA: NADPH-dependent F420 reductase [Steroidobacteraceae bacterium]|nr:NADPH-dependent F420 reductase [Steroidobacteraceae bacterium]HRX90091.1 NADPH-dependent F420 reductase [Steroidobacteraceae bacterium]